MSDNNEIKSKLDTNESCNINIKYRTQLFNIDTYIKLIPQFKRFVGKIKNSYNIFKYNKHIIQCYQRNGIEYYDSKENKIPVKRILKHGKDDNMPYIRKSKYLLSTVHWGQRKLFISEMECLTKYGHLGKNVIYVGAAQGRHIQFLSECFPEHNFHLFDINDNWIVKNTNKITINNKYFNNDIAKEYYDKYKGDIIYFSDIRNITLGDDNISDLEKEKLVWIDMNMQKQWLDIMKPNISMLKFRLPFSFNENPLEIKGDYKNLEYFDGEIYLQAWAGYYSTETRLYILGEPKLKKYDWRLYESEMFYFNNITRTKLHNHKLSYLKDKNLRRKVFNLGIDRCYDCSAEVYIVNEYLKMRYNREPTIEELIKFIENLDFACSDTKKLIYYQPHYNENI